MRWIISGLKKDGFLWDDSPRGRWELSEKGRHEVRGSLSKEPANFVEHLLAMPNVGEDGVERPRTGPRSVEL